MSMLIFHKQILAACEIYILLSNRRMDRIVLNFWDRPQIWTLLSVEITRTLSQKCFDVKLILVHFNFGKALWSTTATQQKVQQIQIQNCQCHSKYFSSQRNHPKNINEHQNNFTVKLIWRVWLTTMMIADVFGEFCQSR